MWIINVNTESNTTEKQIIKRIFLSKNLSEKINKMYMAAQTWKKKENGNRNKDLKWL